MIILPDFHEVSYANANQAREEMLRLSPAARQKLVENLLYRYPRFNETYGQLSLLHRPGPQGAPITGQIAGFLGNSRAGKSWLLKTFLRENKPYRPADGAGYVFPMAYIEVMERWGAPDVASALFLATGASSVPYISGKSLETKCVRRVATHGTPLVVFDDAHYIFAAPPAKRRSILSLIKALVDSRACSVWLAGLNTVESSMLDESQHLNRGGFPTVHLAEHDLSLPDEFDDYLGFLIGVSNRLPFAEDSMLDREEWQAEWRLAANGSVGLTMNIVIDAARRAIADGSPCIQGHHLREVCFMRKRIGDLTYPFEKAA
ncbi:AAA family ATPase [Sinorhizobium medicae]|nr:AAA family ATPase [Sinorhizobium medicae]MDX0417506.1 AAA family ATPase [Sinorhizobium medicae]MDX1031870.1 AAA family ATPase [Sinorhizobium medicae]MDX1191905.1 AAA family ATPase [Sinorhizobium medicae]MDX1234339.1 AAA family ATPase [Sinorhizobium medicae]